jgi:hypothetical protein
MSFLYDPKSNYGYKGIPGPWGKARSYLDTYGGGMDVEQNPQDYWTNLLGKRGLGGMDTRSQAARGLYGQAADAYGAARLENNELKWKDFASALDIDSLLNNMTGAQKGQNTSNVVPHNVRWLPR